MTKFFVFLTCFYSQCFLGSCFLRRAAAPSHHHHHHHHHSRKVLLLLRCYLPNLSAGPSRLLSNLPFNLSAHLCLNAIKRTQSLHRQAPGDFLTRGQFAAQDLAIRSQKRSTACSSNLLPATDDRSSARSTVGSHRLAVIEREGRQRPGMNGARASTSSSTVPHIF